MTPLRRTLLLLPGHGPEDLPEELEEADAESLLAAAAVAWHPALVRRCDAAPHWDRADDPPPVYDGSIVLIPTGVASWVPGEWREQADSRGAVILEGCTTRAEYLAAIDALDEGSDDGEPAGSEPTGSEPIGSEPADDPDLVADLLALGTCSFHLVRLARRLHIFDDVDTDRLWRSVSAAAVAGVSPDDCTAALHRAFETLLEFRERLYPVDASLIDVVLVEPDRLPDLTACLAAATPQAPLNLMGTGEQFTAAGADPGFRAALDAAGDAVDLIVGEASDHETMLAPLDETAAVLARTQRAVREATGRIARVWGRREMGLRPQSPTLLKGAKFDGALHVGFSHGEYPDEEDARVDWIGLDQTPISACSRLPLPSTRAASMWSFPMRLGESMELDYAAVVLMVRLADGDPQWLDDLRRAARYGPVFGPLATVADFFAAGSGGARQLKAAPSEYRSAALPARAARQDADTHTAEVDRWRSHVAGATASITAGLVELATGQRPAGDPAAALAAAIGSGSDDGLLCVNASPRERVVVVRSPQPLATGPLAGLQQRDGDRWASLVKVPPLGYAWFAHTASVPPGGASLVDDGALQNEFFRVTISAKSGGIQSVRRHASRDNLLSQQLCYRDRDEDDPRGRMVLDGEPRLSDGPLMARAKTAGRIVDEAGQTLARFRQVVTVTRGQRTIGLDIALDPVVRPDASPWTHHYACRWAWAASGVAVSQSSDWDVVACPMPTRFDAARMESPLLIEIADEPRVTLLPGGQTWHRRTEARIAETILQTRGSRDAEVALGIAIGELHPAEAAWDGLSDVATTPCRRPAIESAWLAQVSEAGTLVLGIDESPNPRLPGLVVTLRETEGRRGPCRLTLCRDVREALLLDWLDQPSGSLPVIDGAVEIPLRGHDLKRVFVALA